jgi:hypothetical protein
MAVRFGGPTFNSSIEKVEAYLGLIILFIFLLMAVLYLVGKNAEPTKSQSLQIPGVESTLS